MDSDHNDSYEPSQSKPCANNCGFFGTAENMNLCSKCYRDLCLQEERAASAKTAVRKAAAASLPSPATHDSEFSTAASSSYSSSGSLSIPAAPSNRCRSCNKKVGLTGFVCKCGVTFCGVHRYPEEHDCSYDFKSAGREAISKANPVVKTDKIQRF